MEAPPRFACRRCGSKDNLLRCRDCWLNPVWCKECCLLEHALLPFHRVEMWTGKYFQRSALVDQGYILPLGHDGKQCPSNGKRRPSLCLLDDCNLCTETKPPQEIVIVHSNGIFIHNVHWCSCDKTAHHLQLSSSGLFPASMHKPSTAFTHDVLDHFHIDALECKTTALSFFNKLRRLTDDVFPSKIKVEVFINYGSHFELTPPNYRIDTHNY